MLRAIEQTLVVFMNGSYGRFLMKENKNILLTLYSIIYTRPLYSHEISIIKHNSNSYSLTLACI